MSEDIQMLHMSSARGGEMVPKVVLPCLLLHGAAGAKFVECGHLWMNVTLNKAGAIMKKDRDLHKKDGVLGEEKSLNFKFESPDEERSDIREDVLSDDEVIELVDIVEDKNP